MPQSKKDKFQTKREEFISQKLVDKLDRLEAKFTRRLNSYFRNLTTKIANGNIDSVTKRDINKLNSIIEDMYKETGKAASKDLNKEIKSLTGEPSKVRVGAVGTDLRVFSDKLSKDMLQDFQAKIRTEINSLPTTGVDKADFKRAIRKSSKSYRGRLKTIARNETTRAVNDRRIEASKKSKFVQGVQFLAILDKNTTDICDARHGKILKLDSPELPAYTPPLHHNCRSILSPVSVLENPTFASTTELKAVPKPAFDD